MSEQKQEELSYEEIKEQLEQSNESIVELDRLSPQHHVWVDRGAKLTCEAGVHPPHEVWKRR